MVTATGADFSAILRLVFAVKRWAMLHIREYPRPSELQFVLLALRLQLTPSRVAVHCCWLLAADDADFMSYLFLGFGSGSIGFSVDSCDVGAAYFSAGAAVVTLLLLSFFVSSLCISSANASLITSLLRSTLSAPG